MKHRGIRGLCLLLAILLVCGLVSCGFTENGGEPIDTTQSGDHTGDNSGDHTGDTAPDGGNTGSTEEPEETDPHLYRVEVTGLVSGDPASASSNTQTLNTAIASAKESTTLLVGEGTYYFSSVSVFGNLFTLAVSQKKDLTIRGETGKTTFVNTS